MLSGVLQYFRELSEAIGNGWNQFWFTPQLGGHLIVLRQLVGVFTFVWLASFSFELVDMFGESGWISHEVVHQVATDGDLESAAPGFSYLFLTQSKTWLWALHLIGLAITSCVALGIRPRITTPLAFLVVLNYVHRAPMVTSVFETVLCMLLLYLSIGGPAANLIAWRRGDWEDRPSWLSNLTTRLIQIHLCAIYLLIAASKLGTTVWWNGDAAWYLFTDTQHRLVNLDSLTGSSYLFNAITHGWLGFELVFPILVWVRGLRPLLLGISTLVWLFAAVVTGQVGYCMLMLVANLAFLDANQSLSGTDQAANLSLSRK